MSKEESEAIRGPAARQDWVVPGAHLRVRELLDRLPVAAYTCDPDGLITYFNQNAVKVWGRAPKLNDPADRFCGSFKLYSAAGDPITHDQCWMAKALQTETEYNGEEIVVQRPNGERITVMAHANPIHADSGKLLGAVNVLVDVSDQGRAREAQERLAAIVRSSDDAIISKTLDGIILSWNAGAQRLFGYTPDEVIGRSITVLIPPEKLNEEVEILSRLRRGEQVDHYETVRVAKDGRRLEISLTSSPVRDRTGRVVGASKVARDITGRKQAEQALIALKNELAGQVVDLGRLQAMTVRLSTTLEVQPILDETVRTAAAIEHTDLALLSLCDADGSNLRVGSSLGFTDELLQAFARVPSTSGSRGACLRELQSVVVEDVEIDSRVEEPLLKAARLAGVRAVHCTPMLTRSGEIIGVLSTCFREPHRPSEQELSLVHLCARQAVDFIENARLYSKLQKADQAKNEFLATLAHELRNPLAPIRSAVQVLRGSETASPQLEWAAGMIDRQTQQMTRLIEDLLDLARITSNRLELRKERIQLAEVLQVAVETSRPVIEAGDHEFTATFPPDAIYIEGDATRLAQAISNLLNNAAKYTGRGGKVWLTAERQGSHAVITVRDTGLGIAPEMLPNIFEMFTQLGRPLDRTLGGLGIGLTLVKRLIEMHGGTITAESEGHGKGSAFTVRLPGVVEMSDGERPSDQLSARPTTASSLRVLIVDDNRDAADALAILLGMSGNEVKTAYDGLEAVELAAAFRPDVVLLDVGLPKINGYEAAQRIRQEPWGKSMLLIALTGWGHEAAKQRSKEAGFDQHLIKPVDPGVLMETLSALDRGHLAQSEDTLVMH